MNVYIHSYVWILYLYRSVCRCVCECLLCICLWYMYTYEYSLAMCVWFIWLFVSEKWQVVLEGMYGCKWGERYLPGLKWTLQDYFVVNGGGLSLFTFMELGRESLMLGILYVCVCGRVYIYEIGARIFVSCLYGNVCVCAWNDCICLHEYVYMNLLTCVKCLSETKRV